MRSLARTALGRMRRSCPPAAAAVLAIVALTTPSGCSRAPDPGTLAGWNVLLITIDTMRADHLGFLGWTRASTPALDDLAKRGVVFEDAIAAAPVTLPAHASILTGLYPPAHGALSNGRYPLPEGIPTLAERLSQAGYETGAVIGSYVLHRKYGLARGFDEYNDHFRKPLAEGAAHLERRAETVTERAIEWLGLRKATGPFFLWAHYYDPHAPYEPPPPFNLRFALDPYDGEIAYTDAQIGRLLAALRASGHADHTLIIVTGDHGEGLGDGGEETHGLLLRDATLRVPLVCAAPGKLPAGRRVRGVVSQVDIVPTVLDLLGLEAPPDLGGENLRPAIGSGSSADRLAYSMTYLPREFGWSDLSGVRTDDWAWVRAPDSELYDLREDPAERVNVFGEHPDVVSALRSWLESVEARGGEQAPAGMDPEDEEALRALGYAVSSRLPEETGLDPKTMLPVWREVESLRVPMQQKRYDEILRRAPQLLEKDPQNTFLLFMYGQALVYTGREDEGLDYLRRTFELTRDNVQAGTLLARTLAKLGHTDEAIGLLEGFVKADPEIAAHAYNLGVLYASLGRDEEAVDAYERALVIEPESIATLTNLAAARARTREDLERALALADRAIALSDEDDRPRLVRVQVLEAMGDHETARNEAMDLAKAPRLQGVTRQEVAELIQGLR